MAKAIGSDEVKKYREAYGVALATLTEVMLSDVEDTENRIEAAEVVLVYMNPERNKQDSE